MFCSRCGDQIFENARFCGKCGYDISLIPAPQSPIYVQQPPQAEYVPVYAPVCVPAPQYEEPWEMMPPQPEYTPAYVPTPQYKELQDAIQQPTKAPATQVFEKSKTITGTDFSVKTVTSSMRRYRHSNSQTLIEFITRTVNRLGQLNNRRSRVEQKPHGCFSAKM